MEPVQYHIKCKKGDVNKAVLLPGDIDRADYIASSFFQNSVKVSENREYRIYNGQYEDTPIAVCPTGIGCVSAAIALEELINVGCEYFIRVGTAGSLSPNVNPGDIVIATGAVRGDGASKEYIHPAYPAVADINIVNALVNRAKAEGVDYNLGIIRTHDAFYIESPFAFGNWKQRIAPWVEAGVLAVENESSTLFVIGSIKKVHVGTIIVIAGSLVTGEEANPEDIRGSIDKAIRIACGAMVDLQRGENE